MSNFSFDKLFLIKRLGTRVVDNLIKLAQEVGGGGTPDYDDIYSHILTESHRATESSDGFMSSTDKQKVDNAETVQTIVNVASVESNAITVEAGKYYRFGFNVGTLAITLPTITSTTSIKIVTLYLETGSSPAITISGGENIDIEYQVDYEIEGDSKYEISCLWNGSEWVITKTNINIES